MTIAPNFTSIATALLPDLAFSDMQKIIVGEAEEHEFPIVTDTAETVCCRTPFGEIAAVKADRGLRLEVRSSSDAWMSLLKGEILEHLAETQPEMAEQVRWSDAPDADGGLPKNFRFARVVNIQPLGQQFQRVTLNVTGLDSFVGDAIHFRLILPPTGVDAPEWPTVAPNGQTRWPKGEKALHRPVYTIREMDVSAEYIVFDVFVHEGGRVTEWLKTGPVNAQVGIMGPGGGGLVQSQHVHLFGDETAFPAIARIAENLPHEAVGSVILETREGMAEDYPVSAPAGVRVTWQTRGIGRTLAESAVETMRDKPDAFFWFAAEKGQVTRVRAELAADLKARGQDAYIAAYWQLD